MTTTLTYFPDAVEDLVAELPAWTAARVPGSELAILLGALAAQLDLLAVQAEAIYADMTLETAGQAALQFEWAYLYGASNEQLPPTSDTLRAYLQQRAGEDGTIPSLEQALAALLDTPGNRAIPGLPPDVLLEEPLFPADGRGLLFPAIGSGIAFPADGWLQVLDHPGSFYLEVNVLTVLAFDRAAFARACERFRPAHYSPTVINEVSSL